MFRQFLKEFFEHKVTCLGLITAENPQEQNVEPQFNEDNNLKLLNDLQQLGYQPKEVFYFDENAYLVPNISRMDLLNLGEKYRQRSVVYGRKVPEDRNGMTFAWELIEDNKVVDKTLTNCLYELPEFS